MEDLASLLSSSFSVQTNQHSSISSQHPRFSEYKAKESRSSQEQRRTQFLNYQKERRGNLRDHVRRLAENDWSDMPSDDDDDEEEGEDGMDTQHLTTEIRRTYRPHRNYKDQLMLSEWLVDIPAELEKEWMMVLSPIGQRCLVVAAHGWSTSFGRSGFRINKFQSLLPGGGHNVKGGSTILDCIYHEVSKTYYVLDCMCWNSHPIYDSETEFRFFWLQCKIDEDADQISSSTPTNPYKFEILPRYSCELSVIESAMKDSIGSSFQVDGVLFYHRRAHYTFGATPLVGWLKAYMLPEMLGVPVPGEIWARRPGGYDTARRDMDAYEANRKQLHAERQQRKQQWQRKQKRERATAATHRQGGDTQEGDGRYDDGDTRDEENDGGDMDAAESPTTGDDKENAVDEQDQE